MPVQGRVIGVVIMAFILIFAIIHFGVGIGIAAQDSPYNDVFRPQIGLAAVNIIIGLYGIVIGVFGLFSILTDRGMLSKRYHTCIIKVYRILFFLKIRFLINR